MLPAFRTLASPPRRQGFTIIELLVVMAIIAVLAGIAVPRMRTSPRMHVRIAAQQLVRDAELTRNRALSVKRIARIQFNPGAGRYASYGDDNGDNVLAGSDAEIIFLSAYGTRQFSDGVTFGRGNATAGIPGETGAGAITFANDRIDFDSRGMPNPFGTKGTVYLTSTRDAGAVFAIQMSAAGGFRLWTYTANGTWE